ncbi:MULTISPECIES: efflux RND transporter periplasmic adaptor subunit [Methylococcus]|uniref:Efflux RND transporter periplasmic adaptor subunit n=1 Tax=Methylococcus capsulatus TaxID=414 RepID=A0ABZ2F703_METCP|nr:MULTISPECIES: efflux RND transporter periplasmic adaptor subunit [Methylococcus]MDF9392529.1 efflux RND transporter periplasmic adaptor subunit [Methylococcus capsulatus]
MSRKGFAGLVLAASLAVISGWWRYTAMPPAAVSPADVRVPPPAAVFVARVWAESVDDAIDAVGTLLADESVVIRPEVQGRVKAIHFTEGKPVRAGEVLIELEQDEYRAALAQSLAQQELDQATFARMKAMRERAHVSAQQYDEAVSKLKYSNALVERDRVLLQKTVLRAPFDGIVGIRQVSIGEYIDKGKALVNLEALDPVKLDFKVPEKYAGAVRRGLALTAEVAAYPTRAFAGEVYAVDPRLEEESRTLRVRARLPNRDRALRPGMFAHVHLALGAPRRTLFVPESALVVKGSSASVFRVVSGRAVATTVAIGARYKGKVEIVQGLAEGDSVVTEGQVKLRDGAPVSVLETLEHPPAP